MVMNIYLPRSSNTSCLDAEIPLINTTLSSLSMFKKNNYERKFPNSITLKNNGKNREGVLHRNKFQERKRFSRK